MQQGHKGVLFALLNWELHKAEVVLLAAPCTDAWQEHIYVEARGTIRSLSAHFAMDVPNLKKQDASFSRQSHAGTCQLR